ncbi:hypothetical protein ACFQ0B_75865 [Nonomuraea thailandensis]
MKIGREDGDGHDDASSELSEPAPSPDDEPILLHDLLAKSA